MPPTLAVQIVNYHTRAYLERCLQSVLIDLERSGVGHEIHLLDNASGEVLDDLAERHPQVTASVSERNLGFGAGHNRLAAHTQARYLWILNPDVEIIEPDTALRLIAEVQADARRAAAGPRLLTADGTPAPYDHGRLTGPRARLALRGGHSYWRATTRPRRVAWVSGAALMIERAAFTSAGGFDERFFLYKEEEDLCLRLRAAGREVRYDPAVAVRHIGSVVAGQRRWAAESERIFIAEHCRPGRVQRLCASAHQGLAYVHL